MATAIDLLRSILNGFRGLNSKGIYSMNATETDLLRQILLEVQSLSVGSIDLTAPPTSIGTVTPVAVNSTIFTALPVNNTSAFVASGSSLTGGNAQALVNLSQIWNTTGTPTAIFANITDIASNASSLLINLQVGGSTRFSVLKNGLIHGFNGGGSLGNIITFGASAVVRQQFTNSSFELGSAIALGWTSGGSPTASASLDLILARDAANTLAQRNSTNTQVLRLYKSFTDSSNYTRSAWQFDANGLNISGESAGTGDANIDVAFTPKGTGNVRFGVHAAVGAETVTGYITIKDLSGTLRKLAVIS